MKQKSRCQSMPNADRFMTDRVDGEQLGTVIVATPKCLVRA